ncbi:class I SAM-dependent methyltransferase [Natronobacterium texcoconense]|uniref:Methyltransferase domain-containing protein n=1 Tax=Natronobacterium texcoconense TaxID=1095778 RepID=A0A1H1BSX4_NATTX|nr:class I SAM-dependent methyltransferase [Natronobacterium texcoconense]SDQ55001.1 Methyltransferase domain-containing protein [Natronobacterium texcoconense]
MDSTETRREWARRSGEYSPEYYAYYGPDETSETIRRILEQFVGRDASVLELGCSSGRHLSHLYDDGFDDLAGIEINDDAFDVMAEHYPDLASEGTFYADAIEDVLEEFDDGRFDAIYSVETLQHVHPDAEWVFAELSRVTDELLVTVENEGAETESTDGDVEYVDEDVPLYYRDWNRVFTDEGLDEVVVESSKRDTVRAFRS